MHTPTIGVSFSLSVEEMSVWKEKAPSALEAFFNIHKKSEVTNAFSNTPVSFSLLADCDVRATPVTVLQQMVIPSFEDPIFLSLNHKDIFFPNLPHIAMVTIFINMDTGNMLPDQWVKSGNYDMKNSFAVLCSVERTRFSFTLGYAQCLI